MAELIYSFDDEANEQYPMIVAKLYNFVPIYIGTIHRKVKITYEVFNLDLIVTQDSNQVNAIEFNEINSKDMSAISKIINRASIEIKKINKKVNPVLSIYRSGTNGLKINYDIYYNQILHSESYTNCDIQIKVHDLDEYAIKHDFINICNVPSRSKSKFYGFVQDNQTLIVDLTKLFEHLFAGDLVVKKMVALHKSVEYLHNVDIITGINATSEDITLQYFHQIVPTIEASVTLFNEADGCYVVSGTFYYPYYEKLKQIYLWSFTQAQEYGLCNITLKQGQQPLDDKEYEYWDYLETLYLKLREHHKLIALSTESYKETHITEINYTRSKFKEIFKLGDFTQINYIFDEIHNNPPKLLIDQVTVIPIAIYDRVPESELTEINTLLLSVNNNPNSKLRLSEFIRPDKHSVPITDFNKLNESSFTEINSNHYNDDVFVLYYPTYTDVTSPVVSLPINKFKEGLRINSNVDLTQPFVKISFNFTELSFVTMIENDKITENLRAYLSSIAEYTQTSTPALVDPIAFHVINLEEFNVVNKVILGMTQLIDEKVHQALIKEIEFYDATQEFSCDILRKMNNDIIQAMYRSYAAYNVGIGSAKYSKFKKPDKYLYAETKRNPVACRRIETITDDEKKSITNVEGKHPPFKPEIYLSKYIDLIDYTYDWWYDSDYKDHAFYNDLKYDSDYSTFKYDKYEIVINYDHDSIPAYDNFPKPDTWNYDLKYHVIIQQVKQSSIYNLGTTSDAMHHPLCDEDKYDNADFYQVNLLNSFPVSKMHLGIVLRDNDPYIQSIKATKCPIPVVVCGVPDIVFDSEFIGHPSYNKLWVVGQYNHNFYWTADLFRDSQDYISKITHTPLDDVADLIDNIKENITDIETMFIVHEIVPPSEFYLFIELSKQIKNTMHPQLDDIKDYKTWEDFLKYFKDNYTTASVYELSKYNFVRIDSFLEFEFNIIQDKLEYDVEKRDYIAVALGTATSKKYVDPSTDKFVYFGDENNDASEYIVNKLFNKDSSIDNSNLNDSSNIILNRYVEDDTQIIKHTLLHNDTLNLRQFKLKFKYSNTEIKYPVQLQAQLIKSWAAFCPSNVELVPLVNVFKNPKVYQFSDKYNETNFMNAWDYNSDNVHTLIDSDVFNDDDTPDYGQYKLIKIRKIYRYEYHVKRATYEYDLVKGKCFSNLTKDAQNDYNKDVVQITTKDSGRYARIITDKVSLYIYDSIAWESADEYVVSVSMQSIYDNGSTLFMKPCRYYLIYAMAILLKISYIYIQEFIVLMYMISKNYVNIHAEPSDIILNSNKLDLFISRNLKIYLESILNKDTCYSLAKIYQQYRLNCEGTICGQELQMGVKSQMTNYNQQRPLLGSITQTPTQKVISGKVINLNEINRKFQARNNDYRYNKPQSFYLRKPVNPLQYVVNQSLNTILTDYTYKDFYFAEWFISVKYQRMSGSDQVTIIVPDDFFSPLTAIKELNYFTAEESPRTVYVMDLVNNIIKSKTSNTIFHKVLQPFSIEINKLSDYTYNVLEMPMVYWIRKLALKPESKIHEIHARTTPSRAVRQTRFSTAKFNTFDSATKKFSKRSSLLKRTLLIRDVELPKFDEGPDRIKSYQVYLTELSDQGLNAAVVYSATTKQFEFINSNMRERSVDILINKFPITEDKYVDEILEYISKYYQYTQHFYYELDITGEAYSLTQQDMLKRIEHFDTRVSQTYMNTIKMSFIASHKQMSDIDPLYVRKIFENTKIIDDVIIKIESDLEFDAFVKTWSNELEQGRLGIIIDLSHYKGTSKALSNLANKAQYLYNFTQVVLDSKTAYNPMINNK